MFLILVTKEKSTILNIKKEYLKNNNLIISKENTNVI